MNKFYISTSIAYANARPHIGFAMEVIQADVLARYHRLSSKEVFYLTGTDEHGMKLAQAAKEQNLTPQQLVDQNSAYFQQLQELLTLSNNHFIRTTDPEHLKGAQKIWGKMMEAGDIYKSTYEGLYCVGCEAFITEKDLVEGKCPNHNRVPEKLKEENYFFKLSKYSQEIQQRIESGALKIVPESRKHEILAVLKEGLKDISFSRPRSLLEWGIDVPGDQDQVMYVWCDALSNYITGIGYAEENETFQKFWPADVQLIGKDILRFHAAIWIGMLLSAQLPLPRAIYVHGFITSQGKKMSKSLNNVVDPFEVVHQYSADALRYYLLREIPTTDDGDFSQERFKVLYESELANTIGNLVSRVVAMTHKYFEGKVPNTDIQDPQWLEKTALLWKEYEAAIDIFDLKLAIEKVLQYAYAANEYIEMKKPWMLVKEDAIALAQVLYNLLEAIRHIGFLLLPFLPSSAARILSYLHIESEQADFEKIKSWGKLEAGQLLQKAEPLFPRMVSDENKAKKME